MPKKPKFTGTDVTFAADVAGLAGVKKAVGLDAGLADVLAMNKTIAESVGGLGGMASLKSLADAFGVGGPGGTASVKSLADAFGVGALGGTASVKLLADVVGVDGVAGMAGFNKTMAGSLGLTGGIADVRSLADVVGADGLAGMAGFNKTMAESLGLSSGLAGMMTGFNRTMADPLGLTGGLADVTAFNKSMAESVGINAVDPWSGGMPVISPRASGVRRSDSRVAALERNAIAQLDEYKAEIARANEDCSNALALAANLQATLDARKRLTFIEGRVLPVVYAEVTDELLSKFTAPEPQPMFVMSVDIRRSTELMLKAKTPQGFADFITELCDTLIQIVQSHYGVVDKFTGDGILCYFPFFISGVGSGPNAVAAAARCHEAFSRHYEKNRSLFEVVPLDVGLGVGIDFGLCKFVSVCNALTVVGRPVVYACRFAGGPAGKTLLNQSAHDAIVEAHASLVRLTRTSVGIKHESESLAYIADLVDGQFIPVVPQWLSAKLSQPSE